MTKKIDIQKTLESSGSGYPPPFDAPCRNKSRRRLAVTGGLTQIGVNLLELLPGAWSSQRHWHTHADEFVYVIEGEVVLVTDAGDETLRTGDCAAFRAGDPDGHHLQNRSNDRALVLEVGSSNVPGDQARYPEIDLLATASGYFRRDGTRY